MRRLALIGLAIGVAALLTACGGGAAKPTPTPTPRSTGATPVTRTPTPTSASTTAGDANKGKQVFAGTCSACHGANAEGISGLGLPLWNNDFIKGLTDDQLLEFLKVGRPADSPESKTKVTMPPRGGNPALTDQDLRNVIAFLRTLQK
ncbi:Cytochrome c-555 [bacterium HR23]|nr:Cytochrome c-555 [bacterium HR23]